MTVDGVAATRTLAGPDRGKSRVQPGMACSISAGQVVGICTEDERLRRRMHVKGSAGRSIAVTLSSLGGVRVGWDPGGGQPTAGRRFRGGNPGEAAAFEDRIVIALV